MLTNHIAFLEMRHCDIFNNAKMSHVFVKVRHCDIFPSLKMSQATKWRSQNTLV